MIATRLFVFGLGYSAGVLARRLREGGGEVIGSVRQPVPGENGSLQLVAFDGTQPIAGAASVLRDCTHLLSSVPPDADGDPAWRCHRDIIAGMPGLRWIGYLSTTGVYGDRGGGWVDESTPPAPTQARSAQRLIAERQWLELGRNMNVPAQIFRLPGIYGPGRSALDQVRAGIARRVVREGQVFSRIHVEDIATTLLASMQWPQAGAIYNVCDDEPAANADVVAYACALLGKPVPPAVPYDAIAVGMSEMARSFWSDNRRVRNERIKRELGVMLRYPTYREGLRSILAATR